MTGIAILDKDVTHLVQFDQGHTTVKPVCTDHLFTKFITCDFFSNVF